MPPRSWTSQQRPKIFLPFNRTRKKTLLLRPGTVASADCARLLMSLQTLTKNVQELAKEEGEESEAELREATEILEGATFAANETYGGRFFKSTDISFWIIVRFKVASAGGNQFGRFRLFFFLIAGTIHTGSIAAGTRL